MVLIKCPECGKEISNNAKKCINCGYSLKKKKSKKKLLIIIVVFFILTAIGGSSCYILYMNNWNFKEVSNTISNGNFSCILGHDWKEATCTVPETCSVCNTTQGEVAHHIWNKATCIKAKTCKNCMITEGKPLGHTTDLGYCGNCKGYISGLVTEFADIMKSINSALTHVTKGYEYTNESGTSLSAHYNKFKKTNSSFMSAKEEMDKAYQICSTHKEFAMIKQYLSNWKNAIPKACQDATLSEIYRYDDELTDFYEYTKDIGAKIYTEISLLQP